MNESSSYDVDGSGDGEGAGDLQAQEGEADDARALVALARSGINHSRSAAESRDLFYQYFTSNEGSVPLQAAHVQRT